MLNAIEKKQSLGQYFTTLNSWCTDEVREFILSSPCTVAFDPFAGKGDLLAFSRMLGFKKTVGLDIDKSLSFEVNDSLVSIPHIDNAIIITNPPYLAKQSATRKHLPSEKYFNTTTYDDLYLLALDKILEACRHVVAIVPESFINSMYKHKDLLYSISILEENPFLDTENPVCVLCFDSVKKPLSAVKVYKNNNYIKNFQELLNLKLFPKRNVEMSFNDLNGWLALRAVDSTDDKKVISFGEKQNFHYDWNSCIKNTSRHITLINIDVEKSKWAEFINEANKEVSDLRIKSSDVILTPFKGNTKSGHRRRRLDYTQARAILEKTYEKVVGF